MYIMQVIRRAVNPEPGSYGLIEMVLRVAGEYSYIIVVAVLFSLAYLTAMIVRTRNVLLTRILLFAAYATIPSLFFVEGQKNPHVYTESEVGIIGAIACRNTHLILGILLTFAVVLTITMFLTPLLLRLRGKDDS